MPALPDVVIYLEALTRHIVEPRMERLVLHPAFVQRSADPPIRRSADRRDSAAAYSDEILHAARLSPLKQPCPVCGAPAQRITRGQTPASDDL